jgi:hypothetical protein
VTRAREPGASFLRSGNVSGWYARLDRECPSRLDQIEIWLTAWEEALRYNQPVAAMLPSDWPTLPASLLTEPGHVLDHLLCRHDAESDGRSPRGAHPTPTKLADSILADELKQDTPASGSSRSKHHKITLDALPPGFHVHLDSLNLHDEEEEEERDEETEAEISAGKRTRSGVPLPFADPAVGGGLFPARMIRWHADSISGHEPEVREEDTRILLKKLQLLDVCEVAVRATKRRLFLALVRNKLAALDDEPEPGQLARSEVEEILSEVVKAGETLRGVWPWEEKPRLLITNPPWLRIKDRFRGHEDGSHLRKKLGQELRNLREEDGSLRFSTLRGNVNLYRLFLERSLQLVEAGGRIRLIVPDSLLREQSSAPLRALLVTKHEWTSIWAFPESARLFAGVTQGVLVLGLTVGGETDELLAFGPAEMRELSTRTGLEPTVPKLTLERERWGRWSRGDWSVPRLPRDRAERGHLLSVIDELAGMTRLSEEDHWLAGDGERVRVRVGEVDQTNWSDDIHPWKKGSRGVPFIRGIHFRSNPESVWMHHPSFDSTIDEDAAERKQALWRGSIEAPKHVRLACQAIVNAQQTRRLRWIVLPAGCVLGNSVNHLQIPRSVVSRLSRQHGGEEAALDWLCELLNSDKLDAWARAWAANNNVNNYELELLPLPPLPVKVTSKIA